MEPTDRVHVQIAREQREFPKLDYSAKQIVGRIIRLYNIFQQDLDRVKATFGLSPTEFGILSVLRAQGTPYALSPNAINQRRFNTLSSGGMTNILHEMEKRGLIERIPDPSDGRGILVRLTAHALSIMDAAVEARVAQEHRWITALGLRERTTLQELLCKLLVSLEPVAEAVAGPAAAGKSGGPSSRKSAARKPGRRRAGGR